MVNMRLFLGLLLAAVIGGGGMVLDKLGLLKSSGFSAVTLAIIIGMILGNTLYPKVAKHCHDGVGFAKTTLLRLGIILYGFNLTFQQIGQVGWPAIFADAVILSSTFLVTWFLGRKLFKMDEQTVILMGAGASICGAAAVMAAEPVVRAKVEKVTVAIATVVIFGTLAMFWYPEMYRLGWWSLSQQSFGIYIGSSVHEVAQVYAAGEAIAQEVANVAVTTKMIRVMMLAPFLFALSLWLAERNVSGKHHKKIVIPWFAVGFIAVAGFNSLAWLPQAWVGILQFIDTFLLTMAMAALGLTTHLSAIKQAGLKPLLLGLLVMLWLIVAGGVLQLFLG